MALAETPTLLSLDRYAKIMGINPAHFNRASNIGATAEMPINDNSCNDLWPRYSWQNADSVSWEDLARAIANAEDDIALAVGYYPAPKWIAQEVHKWPRHYRRDMWRRAGRNLRGARNSIQLNYGKFIQAGRRATTAIADATVVGGTLVYDTTALTATVTAATTLTDECEVKVYQDGETNPEFEIRPARSKAIAGGTFTAVFDIWLFILPSLWGAYPNTAEDFGAIDVTDTSNLVTGVDVLREYTDFTQASATLYWEPKPRNLNSVSCCSCGSTGCPACSLTTQDGCIHTRDSELGFVVPVPATYDADDEQWDQVALTECRDPDEVKVYYYGGEYDNRWLSGQTCDPLSEYWAQTIAMLATARLERPFCSCGNVAALETKWKTDLMINSSGVSFNLTIEDLANPFGTRAGEIMAWKRIDKILPRRLGGGVI